MPETRYYTVRQEREVKVTANSPAEAVTVGNAAFNSDVKLEGHIGGMVRSTVRETSIDAREDI